MADFEKFFVGGQGEIQRSRGPGKVANSRNNRLFQAKLAATESINAIRVKEL
jgi:hypothetical protein